MPKPTPSELIARHATAVLGQFDTTAHQTRYTRERIEPVPGVSIVMERFQRRDGAQAVSRATDPMGGVLQRGFDGTVAWEVAADGTARILQGGEASVEQRSAKLFYDPLMSPTARGDLVTAGEVEFEGEAAFEVQAGGGRPTADGILVSWYFSKVSGLLIGQVVAQKGEKERETMRVLLQAYRSFGGLLVATRKVTRSGGQEALQTIEEIRWDSVPDSEFTLPAPVRALIKP